MAHVTVCKIPEQVLDPLRGVDEGYICQTVIHELKLAVALTTSEAPYDAGYSGLEDEGLRGFKGN